MNPFNHVLTYVLSFFIYLNSFGIIGSNKAYAQTTPSPTGQTSQPLTDGEKAEMNAACNRMDSGEATQPEVKRCQELKQRDRENKPKQNYSESKKGSNNEALAWSASGDAVTFIGAVVAVVVAVVWMGVCFTPKGAGVDGILYLLAAILWIVMAVWNWFLYKGASDKETKIYKDQETGKQEKAFAAAEKQTREAAKSAQRRADNTQMAAIALTAAAAIAIIVWILSLIQPIFEENFDDCDGMDTDSVEDAAKPEIFGMASGPIFVLFMAMREASGELIKKTKESIQKYGIVRSIWYLIMAAVAWSAYFLTLEAVKIYEDRADQYARLRRKLESLKAKKVELKKLEKTDITLLERDAAIQAKEKAKQKCITGNRPSGAHWDEKCKCAVENKCKKGQFPQFEAKGYFDVSPINGFMSDLNGASTAAYKGDHTTAARYQNQANRKKNAINSILRKVMQRANEEQRKRGLPVTNFDKEVKEGVKRFLKKVKESFDKLSPKNQAIISNFAGVPAGKYSGEFQKRKKSRKVVRRRVKQSFRKKQGKNFKLAEEHSKADSFAEAAEGVNLAGSKNNDIDQDEDRNLFEKIHVRYLLSYPKLLNSSGDSEEEGSDVEYVDEEGNPLPPGTFEEEEAVDDTPAPKPEPVAN